MLNEGDTNELAILTDTTEARDLTADGVDWGLVANWSGGGPSLAGPSVNERSALGLTAVYNAVNIYANAVACLDIGVYRSRPNGGKQPFPDHPINYIVQCEPNDELTAFVFWHTIICHVYTTGNGYAETVRDEGGRTISLCLLDPHNVEVKRTYKGRLYYYLKREGRILLKENVLHFHTAAMKDGLVGMSPITVARESLGLALAVQEFASGIYGNSTQPGGVIEFVEKMGETAQAKHREQVEKLHRGTVNAGRLMYLPLGAKFTPTDFSPLDSQFIVQANFSVSEVARLFNIPSSMLGNTAGTSLTNAEDLNAYFYEKCLMPLLVHIEDECNRKLFFRSERPNVFVFHDYGSYLRANTAGRTAYYSQMRNIGVFTTNDILLQEGFDPIADELGGNTRIVQGAFIKLEDVGKAYEKGQPHDQGSEGQQYPTTGASPDQPPDDQADNSDKASVRALAAFTNVVRDVVERSIRREVKALEGASRKPEQFPAWVDDFYGKHVSFLKESLAPSLTALSALRGKTLDNEKIVSTIVSESRSRLEALYKTVEPTDLAAAIDREIERLKERAGQITTNIMEAE